MLLHAVHPPNLFSVLTNARKEEQMDITSLLIFLVIGAVAGWIAGTIMKGRGFGLIGNIIVGVIGSFVGGFLFRLLKISTGGGLIGPIITAIVGAVILLVIIGVFKKA